MTDYDTKFYAPDAAFLLALAQAAIGSLPEDFRAPSNKVALVVQEFVSDEQFQDLGLEDPFELTALFQNTPETIVLFRRPILDEWAERGDVCLADLILHILVHELANQFGWDEARINAHPSLSVGFRAAQRRLSEREG